MSEVEPVAVEEVPCEAKKEEQFFLVNRLTDAQTRVQRNALPRTLRGKRVIHLFGRPHHPARFYRYSRSFLLQHRDELEKMERSGMIGFQRMNLEWVKLSEGLPPGVERKPRPAPFSIPVELPIGDMPIDASTVPPEGGFQREPPKAWSKGTDPAAIESLQKMIDQGLLNRAPDPSRLLKPAGQEEVREPEPVQQDAFEDLAEPPAPAPAPFRKRAELVEAPLHDPFADPEE